MAAHDHPLFTQIYRLIARVEDNGAVGRARTEVSAGLHGRLLIVGIGPAEDLHHLPEGVTEVVGVEPSASMRHAAHGPVARARSAGLPVTIVDAVGERLPFADDSFDSVLFAYVLCTVDDPALVIAEAGRVLRPGGVIAVLEHVAAAEGTWMRRLQRLAAPWWPYIAGGCHCDRDTGRHFAAAGYDTAGLQRTNLVNVPPVAPAVVGTVAAPG